MQMPEITIEAGSDTDGEALVKLIEALSRAVEISRDNDNLSNSSSVVGSRGNTFAIEREFERPVAVAFEALSGPDTWFHRNLCERHEPFIFEEESDLQEPELVMEPKVQEDN